MSYQTDEPYSLTAGEGPVPVAPNGMSACSRHEVVADGQVQAEFYVAGLSSAAKTVTASTGSPVIVNLNNVIRVDLTETGGAAAEAVLNGK